MRLRPLLVLAVFVSLLSLPTLAHADEAAVARDNRIAVQLAPATLCFCQYGTDSHWGVDALTFVGRAGYARTIVPHFQLGIDLTVLRSYGGLVTFVSPQAMARGYITLLRGDLELGATVRAGYLYGRLDAGNTTSGGAVGFNGTQYGFALDVLGWVDSSVALSLTIEAISGNAKQSTHEYISYFQKEIGPAALATFAGVHFGF